MKTDLAKASRSGRPESSRPERAAETEGRSRSPVPALNFGLASAPVQPAAPSRNGLPQTLKSGIEALSGHSMDHVRVHRNSSKPATLQAHAFAQGRDIHLGPGQERHLPHEAWHVVQQAQGRVPATARLAGGVAGNNDKSLEREADVMGARALRTRPIQAKAAPGAQPAPAVPVIQRKAGIEFETGIQARVTKDYKAAEENSGWVDQDEMMGAGQGWHIDSDNSRLEFVTDAFDVGQLQPVLNDMLAHVERLPLELLADADLGTLLQLHMTKPYTALKYKRTMAITGAPQGTIGIPFEKLFSFFNLLTHYQMSMSELQITQNKEKLKQYWLKWKTLPAGVEKNDSEEKLKFRGSKIKQDGKDYRAVPESDARVIQTVTAAVEKAIGTLTLGNKDDLAKLKGLLHFVGQYVIYAQGPGGSYEKMRFPVMARSSFNSMYEALAVDAQGQFVKAANTMIGVLKADSDTMLLPDRPDAVRLKVGDWLASIVTPVDVATPNGMIKSDRMTAPGTVGKGSRDTDKSMGSMGVDAGGLVVVELRQFQLAFNKNSFTTNAARQLVADLSALLKKS